MGLHDRPGDGEADPHAFSLRRIERLEYLGDRVRWNPVTAISHGHLDPPIASQRRDVEVPALPRHLARGFDPVEEDIEEYLLEMDSIPGNRLEVPRQFQTEPHAL